MDRIKEQTKAHHARVIKYYDITQRFYKWFWHGETLGLHYGFWQGGVRNRKQAILKENEVLADIVGIKSGELVLDAGCGIGGSALWLARERDTKVLGLDLTHSQLKEAQNLAAKRGLRGLVGFVEGDYQQSPLQDSSVDVFCAIESIEHATDTEKVISEAYRVLKPQGRIVIAGMFKGREKLTSWEKKQFQTGMEVAACFDENSFKTSNEMRQIMESAGFVEVIDRNKKSSIMESSRQMARMCRLGLPLARLLVDLHLVNPILIGNNKCGIYQEELYRLGGMTYNVLTATKP